MSECLSSRTPPLSAGPSLVRRPWCGATGLSNRSLQTNNVVRQPRTGKLTTSSATCPTTSQRRRMRPSSTPRASPTTRRPCSSGGAQTAAAFPFGRALRALFVFALTPNSASCERVFAALKLMFGEQQMAALADQIRAAVMLSFNDRTVG